MPRGFKSQAKPNQKPIKANQVTSKHKIQTKSQAKQNQRHANKKAKANKAKSQAKLKAKASQNRREA